MAEPRRTLTLGRDDTGSAVTEEPVLVLVFEASRPGAGSVRYRLADLTRVTFGRGSARQSERTGDELAIQVQDPWMSSRHAHLEPTFGRWTFTDESKNGSLVDGHPAKRLALDQGSTIELGHTLFVFYERLPIASTSSPVLELHDLPITHTLMPTWELELGRLAQITSSSISILIEGERGVGKRTLARSIHERSGRTGELIELDCRELPPHLIDGELFGDEDFEGLLRAATGGTLILEDVGALPDATQATLAKALLDRSAGRAPHHQPIAIDVRVIATTERDADELIAAGTLRPELFTALSGLCVTVPPLRERCVDLGLAIGGLHQRLFAPEHPGFEIDAARALLHYRWPLNFWELERALSTAQALAGPQRVRLEHLPDSIRTGRDPGTPRLDLDATGQALHDRLLAALREHRGNISAIARELAKDRKQISRWLQRFGFDPDRFR